MGTLLATREDPEARLCGQVMVTAPDGKTYFVFVDLADGVIRKSYRLPTDSVGPVQLFTGTERYPAYEYGTCQDSECATSGTCAALGADKCNSGGNCVQRCTSDLDCGSDWKCNTSSTCKGYCYMDPAVTPAWNVEMPESQAASWALFYWNGFVDTSVSLEPYYANAATVVNNVVDFHVSDLLRAGGWDNNGGAYWLKMWGPCDCGGGPCGKGGQGCLAPVGYAKYDWGGYSEVRLFHYGWLWNFDADASRAAAHATVGHEYTHLIAHADIHGGPTADKLGENIPDIFGSLFSVASVGGSDVTWQDGCWNTYLEDHVYFQQSSWRDETTGSSPGCFLPDRAQRSRYDMQFTYNAYANAPIWSRFARILAEGPNTFAADGNNEDIGLSFVGSGLGATIGVVYTAFEALSPSTTLYGWVRALEQAGVATGNAGATRKALGAVGYFTEDAIVTTGPATSEAVAAEFNAYSETRKRFTAWRDSSNQVKVQYWSAGATRTITVGQGAAGHPSLIEYNSKLYVFWVHDDGDGAGQTYWRYFSSTGSLSSSTYRFSYPVFWRATGAVEPVVFQGDLYVVYSVLEGVTGHLVALSRCTATTCTDDGSNWVLYDLGAGAVSRSKPLLGTFNAYLDPGVGAVAAEDVGSVDGEYLYLFGQKLGSPRLWRVGPSDEVVDTHEFSTNEMELPDGNSDGQTAAGQLAIGALPDALESARSHLYLYWKSSSSGDVYGMIIRDPSVSLVAHSSTVDTFRNSAYGASFVKGVVDQDRVDIVLTQSNGTVVTARQYGRY